MKPSLLFLLPLLLLPACAATTVQHGDPQYAAVETEARTRILSTLKTLNSDQRDTVKYAAPVTSGKKLSSGETAIVFNWHDNKGARIVAQFVGNTENPATGKFTIYMLIEHAPQRLP